MKVLLINDYFEQIGGAEQLVYATQTVLEENGHSVRLYAPAHTGLSAGRLFSIKHYFAVQRMIQSFKPNIVHVHNIYRNVSASVILAARCMKVPIVMTLHDFQIVCPKTSLVDQNLLNCETGFDCRCFYSNCYPRKPFNRAYQGLKAIKLAVHRLIIRKTVHHFFSPSVCLMDWTRKNLGVNNISLLPNFVASEHEPSSKPPTKNALLFVGKLTEQKGVDVLIKAMAKVRQVIPDVSLRIVGDGPDEQKLKRLAAALNLADHVFFTGKLSNERVMKEYDNALLIIIPSKYIESFGLVGLEAMSKGKVIIASRIGGLPDLVDENETGFLVKPGDIDDLTLKIVFAIRNQSILTEMGASARAKYVGSFSKQAYYRTLLSVYNRIIHEAHNRNAQFR